MAFKINSELIAGSLARYFRDGGLPHYNVRISLTADNPADLDRVKSVRYELHPTFKNRYPRSIEREREFEIRLWTYGFFTARAELIMANGDRDSVEGMVRWEIPTAA